MDSRYPSDFDDDTIFPPVDDNITEIGGEAINGLRSAVFAIEEALGLDPQGSASDVASRLDVSINSDGTLKSSALALVGLVTLPITNSQVGSNAGIEESKLDLDYSTVQLKTWIDTLDAFVTEINNRVIQDIFNLTLHTAHPSSYGRHYLSDIDGYTGTYASYNLQGIVTDLDTRIIDHITDLIDAHDASAISVDDTALPFSADEVQTALELLGDLGDFNIKKHQDRQHSNGTLRAQKTYFNNTGLNTELVSQAALNTVSAGSSLVVFSSPPAALSSVTKGDVLAVITTSQTFYFDIDTVNSSSGTITFFGTMPITATIGSVDGIIYRTTEETTNPSSLKVAMRQANIGASGGSMVQVVHPNSPFVLSNGIDVRKLSTSSRYLKFRWSYGESADIDAYGLMKNDGAPSIWTTKSLAEKLNSIFRAESSPGGSYSGSGFPFHYPLVAFEHNGELGVAFDEPDGYVEIVAPSSNSASTDMGLIEGTVSYSVGDRRSYIDGYGKSSMRVIVDAYGESQVSSPAIINLNTDLTSLGLTSGLVRVTGSLGQDDGTYAFTSVGTDSIVISEHVFSADSSVRVKIYADVISVPTAPSEKILYELFVDGYDDNVSLETRSSQRVSYGNNTSATDNPLSWFNIIEISRNYGATTKRINFQDVSGIKTLTYGNQGSGQSVTGSISSVVLPINNAEGYQFKLYDNDGINYIELEVASSAYTTVTNENAIDITIYDHISEEKYLQIGQVTHDISNFVNLSDRRLFGTVGRKDVRSDYSRDYINYPLSLMHNNGVLRDCKVHQSSSSSIDAYGGEAFVNGSNLLIERRTFEVPTDGSSATYNVFIDDSGILHFLKDDQYVSGKIATPSVLEIISDSSKLLVARVTVDATNSITSIVDVRRFVGNLDNKVDLLVEESEITHGSFDSLNAAVNYLSLLSSSSPQSRILKIKGSVTIDRLEGAITLPDNVIIRGDFAGMGDTDYSRGSKLHIEGAFLGGAIVLGNNCAIENLTITHDYYASADFLFGNSSSAVNGLRISNCLFDSISLIDGGILYVNSISNALVENCVFNFASGGKQRIIKCLNASDNIVLKNCTINFNTTSDQYVFELEQAQDIYMLDGYVSGDNAIVFEDPDTLKRAYVERNFFKNSNICDCSGSDLSDISIVNNRFDVLTSMGGNLINLSSGEHSNIVIKENMVNLNGGTIVSFFKSALSTTLQNLLIEDNIFNLASGTMTQVFCVDDVNNLIINGNIVNSSIALTYMAYLTDVHNAIIENNIIETSGATQNFIYFTNTDEVIIKNNIFKTTATTAPGGSTEYMVFLDDIADYSSVIIDGNILSNPPGDYNFYGAIKLDGAGSDYYYSYILNNTISTFDDSNQGDGIFNGENALNVTTISGNSISAANPILIHALASQVSNNYLLGSTSTDGYMIKVTGYPSGLSSSGLVNSICNNYIKQINNGPSTFNLIEIDCNYMNISNNTITHVANFTKSLVYFNAGSGKGMVIGNTFSAPLNVFSAEMPVKFANSTGGSYIVNNSFIIPYSGQMIDSSGNNVNLNNKGETYNVLLPPNLANVFRDNTGSSTWSNAGSFSADQTTYAADSGNNAQLEFPFDSSFVPIGAEINSITMLYSLTGVTSNLTVKWAKFTSLTDLIPTYLVSVTNVSSTGSSEEEVLTPPSAEYMEDGHLHYLITNVVDSGSYDITVFRAYINYTL